MADDKVIADQVKSALNRYEQLQPQDIQVQVEGGVVTLNGTVSTEQDRLLAEGIAGTSGDVEMVVNELKIKEELPG
jgi:osmotically-inducible protein OsmY